MIEKLLKEVEEKLRIVSRLLEEKGKKHESLYLNLWLNWNTRGFKVKIWDGEDHTYNAKEERYDFSPEELTQYLKEREILFQKFPNFSD